MTLLTIYSYVQKYLKLFFLAGSTFSIASVGSQAWTSLCSPLLLVSHKSPSDSPSQWVDNLTTQKLLSMTGIFVCLGINWPEKQPVRWTAAGKQTAGVTGWGGVEGREVGFSTGNNWERQPKWHNHNLAVRFWTMSCSPHCIFIISRQRCTPLRRASFTWTVWRPGSRSSDGPECLFSSRGRGPWPHHHPQEGCAPPRAHYPTLQRLQATVRGSSKKKKKKK